jgi:hypothetical protein
MKRSAPLATALALACCAVAVAQSGPPEVLLGGIDAVLFVCGPIDAKTAKDGVELQTRLQQQFKLDLPAVRKLPAYIGAYNTEVNRLLLLPAPRKAEACKNVF